MVKNCAECGAVFFKNQESQKIARRHIALCGDEAAESMLHKEQFGSESVK